VSFCFNITYIPRYVRAVQKGPEAHPVSGPSLAGEVAGVWCSPPILFYCLVADVLEL